MDNSDDSSLDLEFKKYLLIAKPYLSQLVDQDVINVCNAWLQKLSTINIEKNIRNKYIFTLCYQLARGYLDKPFSNYPPLKELLDIPDITSSDESSTELNCVMMDVEENKTTVLFEAHSNSYSDAEDESKQSHSEFRQQISRTIQTVSPNKQTILCYACPDIQTNFNNHDGHYKAVDEQYNYRANNLVVKLREIKHQNTLLQNELTALKEEAKHKAVFDSKAGSLTNTNSTNLSICDNGSRSTLKSLKTKLQEMQNYRDVLIETISEMQEKIDNMEDIKKQEIQDVEAKHKLEMIQIKSAMKDECLEVHNKKIDDMKKSYETSIEQLKDEHNKKLEEVVKNHEHVLKEKINVINEKEEEISQIKSQLEEQKNNLNCILNKFLDRPDGDCSSDSVRFKNQQLEKRMSKVEKSKYKCMKTYETKLAYLQREKHLAECSLQLQLVRQRAQVLNEVADENQSELATALDKLESKYKGIVANVQATAIQRRIQDQIALESLLQACGIQSDNTYGNSSQNANHTQLPLKTMRNQNRETVYNAEMSPLVHGNKVTNGIVSDKSYGEDSILAGYCLDSERMGELFERVYIPQRDTGEAPLRK